MSDLAEVCVLDFQIGRLRRKIIRYGFILHQNLINLQILKYVIIRL